MNARRRSIKSFGVGICVNNIYETAELYVKVFILELSGIDLFTEAHTNCGKYLYAEMRKDGKSLFVIQGMGESQCGC